ncbi:MAG: hypothetical protein A3E78_01940 [Alphaproteobacteria bacterium RIFCSPHIGHO2_12_FULL_63_12]|nr:MAG: hypothetical protein A3E78_01940 [Alphaproteobacteria bacterium RIFCSPHIGHO2_12_FULL_63_12]
MAEESKTITLSQPITAHGESITKLVLREPTAKDIEATDKAATDAPTKKANMLLASVAGIPYSSVLLLRLRDWNACMEALAEMGFFEEPSPRSESEPESHQTGPTE